MEGTWAQIKELIEGKMCLQEEHLEMMNKLITSEEDKCLCQIIYNIASLWYFITHDMIVTLYKYISIIESNTDNKLDQAVTFIKTYYQPFELPHIRLLFLETKDKYIFRKDSNDSIQERLSIIHDDIKFRSLWDSIDYELSSIYNFENNNRSCLQSPNNIFKQIVLLKYLIVERKREREVPRTINVDDLKVPKHLRELQKKIKEFDGEYYKKYNKRFEMSLYWTPVINVKRNEVLEVQKTNNMLKSNEKIEKTEENNTVDELLSEIEKNVTCLKELLGSKQKLSHHSKR